MTISPRTFEKMGYKDARLAPDSKMSPENYRLDRRS